MEGIADGQAVDTCFHCALLYPPSPDQARDPASPPSWSGDAGDDDCPRCGQRMRYRPAAIHDEAMLRDRVRQHRDAYVHAATPDDRARGLIALLTLLHDHAPAALAALQSVGGPALDALRRDYESLGLRRDPR